MPTRSDFVRSIAASLSLKEPAVAAVIDLLGQKATVPFIARYRKEATGSLDEVQIRAIEERLAYLRELEDRRATVLASIADQGKLDDTLRRRIESCASKTELEDVYLPFKPKRRTRATVARERGLEPLAERILAQPVRGRPEQEAEAYVDPTRDVPDAVAALAGARDVIAERLAEHADARRAARASFGKGVLESRVVPKHRGASSKFEQYYDFDEPASRIPSHRYLAIRRGEEEGVLRVRIAIDLESLQARLERLMGLRRDSPFAEPLREAIRDGLKRLLAPSVENEVRGQLKQRADAAAVEVFAENLRNLLMAAPLGGRPVLAVDPGLRTGCKLVALDGTGGLLGHDLLHLHRGERDERVASEILLDRVREWHPAAIAVGNGTGGREAERFIRNVLRSAEVRGAVVVSVNEAGASVYSASEIAREEFPELDLTVRGAISIGRRLQDPLAELVKIEPKAIGVGQYQHDVHQALLSRKLDEIVESCVHAVGVELNTASAALLARVSGIGSGLARKIVAFRKEHGAFRGRKQLSKVPGLGPKAFEQAAGFLRVAEGEHPLDASAVHPERYSLVERMARDLGVNVGAMVGDATLAARIEIRRYTGRDVGEPTLRDIVRELEKPGRDPRADFEPPRFREDVQELEDLKPGMRLEGVVTNVTAFGAFVDVGVHQDGLVHISQLANRFVRDPKDVVKVGDKVRVAVLEVDRGRKRIALSARENSMGGGS